MVRILIPPGIGDAYWVLVKLPAFLKRNGLSNPELTVLSRETYGNSHLRSLPFLQMFDFVSVGTPQFTPNTDAVQSVCNEAYLGPGRSIFQDVLGYDYFIAYNGRINSGGWIEDDDIECNWYPEFNFDLESIAAKFRSEIGPYAVLSWLFAGSFQSHMADFPIPQIAEALNSFLSKTNLTPVFTGADWDIVGPDDTVRQLARMIPGSIDLIGKTSLQDSFGLLKVSEIVTGYHAGLTNIAAVFGIKTLLLWDDRYPESTSWACVPPKARRSNYSAIKTKGLTPDKYSSALSDLYNSTS